MTRERDEVFFYLRKADSTAAGRRGTPVGVVAMCREGNLVRVAGSLCSKNDQWCRKAGVAKALGRLRSRQHHTHTALSGPSRRVLPALLRRLGLPVHKFDIDETQAFVLYEKQMILFNEDYQGDTAWAEELHG